jgi:hypothetical protein
MKRALLFAATLGLFLSCQTSTIGLACLADGDCDHGQSCFSSAMGFPGGYCTRGCTQEGVLTECPQGSICTKTSVGSVLFCSTICSADGDCRGGQYTCNGVTGSNQKACRP